MAFACTSALGGAKRAVRHEKAGSVPEAAPRSKATAHAGRCDPLAGVTGRRTRRGFGALSPPPKDTAWQKVVATRSCRTRRVSMRRQRGRARLPSLVDRTRSGHARPTVTAKRKSPATARSTGLGLFGQGHPGRAARVGPPRQGDPARRTGQTEPGRPPGLPTYAGMVLARGSRAHTRCLAIAATKASITESAEAPLTKPSSGCKRSRSNRSLASPNAAMALRCL